MDRTAELDQLIQRTLDDDGLTYERTGVGAYLLKLEGIHRLATMCWLVVGDHSLLVEAFFLRRPDENEPALHRWLLARNARMYGVAYSIDAVGDVYLVGRLSLESVTPAEIDRLLGCVLTYADDTFDEALRIGFATSIRKEWAWRAKRGESLANLAAFARFADPAHDSAGSADDPADAADADSPAAADDSPAAADDSADGSADLADPVHNLADPAHNLSEGSGRLEP